MGQKELSIKPNYKLRETSYPLLLSMIKVVRLAFHSCDRDTVYWYIFILLNGERAVEILIWLGKELKTVT